MPKLYKSLGGSFYTKPVIKGQIVTLQIRPEGADWLRAAGYKHGDELGTDYWELVDNDWLFTKGEVAGGGEINLEPVSGNDPRSMVEGFPHIGRGSSQSTTKVAVAASVATQTYAPRFLFDRGQSVYYTQLTIANSDPGHLGLRVLIKNRGAAELLQMGVSVGDEFTALGLQTLFARRWVYCND